MKPLCEICNSNNKVYFNSVTQKYLCVKHRKQIYAYGHITDSSSFNQNDRNEIIKYDDYAVIILRNKHGEYVGESMIDLDDVDIIKDKKWSLGNHGYVTSGAAKNQLLLHRFSINAPYDKYVDHIDRNKLNNRKNNLRLCTNQENNRNKDLLSNNTSGICGVVFDKARQKWKSQIIVDNKTINLGRFDSFDDAVHSRLVAEDYYFQNYKPDNRTGLYDLYE